MGLRHRLTNLWSIIKIADKEASDGTTWILALAGALLEKTQKLLDKGKFTLIIIRTSSLKISDIIDIAVEVAVKRIYEIPQEIKFDKTNYD